MLQSDLVLTGGAEEWIRGCTEEWEKRKGSVVKGDGGKRSVKRGKVEGGRVWIRERGISFNSPRTRLRKWHVLSKINQSSRALTRAKLSVHLMYELRISGTCTHILLSHYSGIVLYKGQKPETERKQFIHQNCQSLCAIFSLEEISPTFGNNKTQFISVN